MEKHMHKYVRFYYSLSGYYMAYINYIAALTFLRKILQLSYLNDCKMKTRPYKTIIFISKFIPIIYSIIYHHQTPQKFLSQKLLRDLKLLIVLSDRVLFRTLSDVVPYRVFSDRVHFRVFFRILSSRILSRVLSLLFLVRHCF